MNERPGDLCVLSDGAAAAIRWRFSDYEQLLTKELKLLVDTPLRSTPRPPAARQR